MQTDDIPVLPAADTLAERVKVMLSEQAQRVAGDYKRAPVSPKVVSGLIRYADCLLIFFTGLFCGLTYFSVGQPGWISAIIDLFAISCVAVVLIDFCQAYDLRAYNKPLQRVFYPLVLWSAIFAGALLLQAGSSSFSDWLKDWFLFGLASLFVFHSGIAFLIHSWAKAGRLQRRAVIVGGGEDAAALIRDMQDGKDDIKICGIFDDRSGKRSPDVVMGYPRLGTIAELVEFGRKAQIDMLLISVPLSAEKRLAQIIQQLWTLPVEIRIAAQNYKLQFQSRSYSYIGTARFFDVLDKPIADWNAVAKRGFDIIVASLALLCLTPLLIAVAIAIKLDSKGPVFFRQKRYGFNNQIIHVWKFRSMYVDQCDFNAKVAVTKVDPRVTKVGRFIRKTSIDELPQLFNVLGGQLSLVGPRPHAIGSNTQDRPWEYLVDTYFVRHKVKPGVTGWAQINGWRGEVDTEEKLRNRVEHDLYYIDNWNLIFDFYILARTPLALFDTRNAY